MTNVATFFKRYRLASLLLLEGILALASIARSVISNWAQQSQERRHEDIPLGAHK